MVLRGRVDSLADSATSFRFENVKVARLARSACVLAHRYTSSGSNRSYSDFCITKAAALSTAGQND
jgi:hypothetical protein